MPDRAKLFLLAFIVTLFAAWGVIILYNEPEAFGLTRNLARVHEAAEGTSFSTSEFSSLDILEGLTILGDSYSADFPGTWHKYITERPQQIAAEQGASIDDKYCHFVMSDKEKAELAPDMVHQARQLQFLTESVIIWFGINDLMTVHAWSEAERTSAIKNEIKSLFNLVDTFIEVGVKRIIVPNVLDFAQSPGLYLARTVNTTVSLRTTSAAIHEWNQRLATEVDQRPRVSSIDFYGMSRTWMREPASVGLHSLLRTESGLPALWQDFLHMTSWSHEHLIAPVFERALM